jgi:dynein heavy chain 1
MYGGKIDNESDFKILNSLVTSFMTPAAFEEDYNVVKDISDSSDTLILPNSIGWKEFMAWVNDLPEREPPTYLGLPANAEKLLLVGQAKQVMDKLRLIMGILDEGEQVMAEANGA